MQTLNIKEWKLLVLQITQTRHPLSILQKKSLSSINEKQNHEMYTKKDAHNFNV